MDTKKQAAESLASKLAVSLVEVIPHGSFPMLSCQLDSELEMLRGGRRKKANTTGKPNGKTPAKPTAPAVPDLEEEDPLETFSKENIRPASLAMFPAEIKKVISIYSRLRTLLQKYYLCGKFVNVVFMDEILAEANKIIADFDAQILSMYDRWDEEAKRFSDLSWDWLRSLTNLTQEKRRKFHVHITNQLPSKDEFKNRSRLYLEVRPVPSPTAPVSTFSTQINDLIENGWQEQMLEMGQAAVDSCLQTAFDCANNVLRSCLSGHDPATSQRNKMASLSVTLLKNNLFSNQLIATIAGIFSRVTKNSSVGDDLEDEMSSIMFEVWKYHRLSGGNLDLSKSVLKETDFQDMESMRSAQQRLAGT